MAVEGAGPQPGEAGAQGFRRAREHGIAQAPVGGGGRLHPVKVGIEAAPGAAALLTAIARLENSVAAMRNAEAISSEPPRMEPVEAAMAVIAVPSLGLDRFVRPGLIVDATIEWPVVSSVAIAQAALALAHDA